MVFPFMIIQALAGRTAMDMLGNPPGSGKGSGSIFGSTPSKGSDIGETFASHGLTGTHRTGGVAGVKPIPVQRPVSAGPSGSGTVTTQAPPAPISEGGRKRKDTGRGYRF